MYVDAIVRAFIYSRL